LAPTVKPRSVAPSLLMPVMVSWPKMRESVSVYGGETSNCF